MPETPFPNASEVVSELLSSRQSIRGFLPDPLPPETINKLFTMAQMAPSWCNIQSWRVSVTSPPQTKGLSEALVAAAKTEPERPDIDFVTVFPEPYNQHRRQCGGALYGAMNVARGDKDGRTNAWLRNYELFDAPHVAIVSRDRSLGEYGTLDVGVWLGMLLLCAESLGVDACAMASLSAYPTVLREHLGIPSDELILFGLALGTGDPSVPANSARTGRDDVSANVRMLNPIEPK